MLIISCLVGAATVSTLSAAGILGGAVAVTAVGAAAGKAIADHVEEENAAAVARARKSAAKEVSTRKKEALEEKAGEKQKCVESTLKVLKACNMTREDKAICELEYKKIFKELPE